MIRVPHTQPARNNGGSPVVGQEKRLYTGALETTNRLDLRCKPRAEYSTRVPDLRRIPNTNTIPAPIRIRKKNKAKHSSTHHIAETNTSLRDGVNPQKNGNVSRHLVAVIQRPELPATPITRADTLLSTCRSTLTICRVSKSHARMVASWV